MLTEVLSPAEVQALVRLIGKAPGHTGWPTKKDLVLAIPTGGGWVTSGDVAEAVGLGQGTCRRLLQQLEDDRVILRDGGDGDRRFWCEVNPDWERWRVPWRVERRQVRQKLALAREVAGQVAWERFIARPMYARYPEISARLIARDKAAEERAELELARVHGPRDNRGARGAHRADMRARSRSRQRAPQDRALIGGPPKEELSISRDTETTPPSAPPPAVDEADVQTARKAVFARAMPSAESGSYWLRGVPASALVELVARHGVDAVVEATAKVEAGVHMPPRFVEHLADVLAGVGDVDEAQVLKMASRIRQSIASLERVFATYDAEGLPRPEDKLAEHRELVERLAAYDGPVDDQSFDNTPEGAPA